jgi:hypothetical protein
MLARAAQPALTALRQRLQAVDAAVGPCYAHRRRWLALPLVAGFGPRRPVQGVLHLNLGLSHLRVNRTIFAGTAKLLDRRRPCLTFRTSSKPEHRAVFE